MKYFTTALFAALFAFGAMAADEAPWMQTLGRVWDLGADTGISGFLKAEAPAYITGNFSEDERPDLKKGERANRNGLFVWIFSIFFRYSERIFSSFSI